MSPLLWNGDNEPRNRNEPPQDDGTLVFAFVVMTFMMWLVVVVGMIARG